MENVDSWIIALISLLGGIVGTRLVGNYLALRQGNYAVDKARRNDALAECYVLIQKLQEDRDRDRAEQQKLREEIELRTQQHAECEVRFTRAEARIEALEDALKAAGISVHRPWVPMPPSSGVYRPKKEPTKEPPTGE